MKFKPAPPNPFYDEYGYRERLESENGIWTIALYPVLYGVRVQAGLTNRPSFAIDVCCGAIKSDIILGYIVVKQWLETFPESVTEGEIYRSWPFFESKPVMENPEWYTFMQCVLTQNSYLEDEPK